MLIMRNQNPNSTKTHKSNPLNCTETTAIHQINTQYHKQQYQLTISTETRKLGRSITTSGMTGQIDEASKIGQDAIWLNI